MRTTDRLCLISGVLAATLLFTGWAFCAWFMPPPSPALDSAAVAALYRDHSIGIRFGGIMLMAASALLVPFFTLISARMAQGSVRSPLPLAQTILGVLGFCAPIAMIACLWMTAAYRAERAEELVVLLNDMGWIILFAPVFAASLQYFTIAMATLGVEPEVAGFPRWFAYLCIWSGTLYLPGAILSFFKTGPFAWSGVVTFGLAIVGFAVWFIPLVAILWKDRVSISEQEPVRSPV